MAQIQVTDLTFSYDGSADDVLKEATFNIDTDWKLGLIGRRPLTLIRTGNSASSGGMEKEKQHF